MTIALYRCPRCGPTGTIEVELTCARRGWGRSWHRSLRVTHPEPAADAFEQVAQTCRANGWVVPE